MHGDSDLGHIFIEPDGRIMSLDLNLAKVSTAVESPILNIEEKVMAGGVVGRRKGLIDALLPKTPTVSH